MRNLCRVSRFVTGSLCLALIWPLVWAPPPTRAGTASPPKQSTRFAPSIKRVAVFKNGYVFTYREGEARPESNWAYTTDMPAGVLGAVWGYSTTPQVRITQLLASETEKKEAHRVGGLEELLLVNEGAQIRIKTDYSDKIFEGTYVILSPQRTFPVGEKSERRHEIQTTEVNPDLDLALTTATGTMVIKAGRLTYVDFVGQPRWEKTVTTKERRLGLKSTGYAAGQTVHLGLAALERGIRWIPAYRLEVKGEPIKEAQLELEAMVINDLADMTETEMYFVVGVPHFLFKELLSPLSLNTAFAGVSNYFTGHQNSFSNAIMSQSGIVERSAENQGPTIDAPALAGEDSVPAMSAEELFLYRADQISLRKGERASLRLFSKTVACTELFEWMIPDDTGVEQYAQPNFRAAQDLSRSIWYALKLKNQTGMPLTTAPVLSFREWKPLGQDILTFTPHGTETIVRVTPATEVVGVHKIEEKGRVREMLREGSTNREYDLVTVEATIGLRNLKKQPVEMRLTRRLHGEVLEASDAGAIVREGINLQSVNPRSVIKWELMMPPGEKQLRYVYKVYVRR